MSIEEERLKQQFAFAVERPLLAAAGAVGQGVGGAIGQDDVGALAAQQVQRSRVGVGDVRAIESDGVFLVTHHGQRPVGSRSAHHVADALGGAVVGSHMSAVHRHLYPTLRLCHRVGEVDRHLGGERVVLQGVLLFGEILRCRGRRFCRRFIDGYIERGQFATRGRTAVTSIHVAAIVPAVVVIVDEFLNRVFCRAAHQHKR